MERVPDISERWAQLKDLLRDDPEFETRYPVAYELLFEQEATWGVYLPSFGVRVLGNSHQPIAICKRELKGVDHEGGFADAYSLQHDGVFGYVTTDPRWPHSLSVPAPPDREEEEIEVTGRFPPMYGQAWFSPKTEVDMQGVLLAIMGRDELSARGIGIGPLTDRAVYECPPVRITDLRLAVDFFDDAGSGQQNLSKMLRPIIETLPKPISPDAAIRWKRERLETLAGESGGGSAGLTGEEKNRVYRMLRLEVTPTGEGYDLSGALCTSVTPLV